MEDITKYYFGVKDVEDEVLEEIFNLLLEKGYKIFGQNNGYKHTFNTIEGTYTYFIYDNIESLDEVGWDLFDNTSLFSDTSWYGDLISSGDLIKISAQEFLDKLKGNENESKN